jgi:hypothetical protein
VHWPENDTDWYPPTDGYFNLDPRAFGLSFDIFEPPEVIVTKIHGKKTTITTGNYESQSTLTHYPPPQETSPPASYTEKHPHYIRRSLVKRDGTIYPEVCFADCNNAYLESTKTGKTDALCRQGSQFRLELATCNACVEDNSGGVKDSGRTYLDDKFKQFINYCEGDAGTPIQSSSPAGPEPIVTGSQPDVDTRTQDQINTNTAPVPITPSSGGGANPSPSQGGSEPGPAPTATGSDVTGVTTADAISPSESGAASAPGEPSGSAEPSAGAGTRTGTGGVGGGTATPSTVVTALGVSLVPGLVSFILPVISGLIFFFV